MNLIDKLEELDKAATPKPWCESTGLSGVIPRNDLDASFDCGHVDAKLICEMRNALPALLAVVRAAKQLIRGLELVQQLEGQVTEKAWEKELKLQQALTALEESE